MVSMRRYFWAVALWAASAGCAGWPRVVASTNGGEIPRIEAEEEAKQRAFWASQREMHCDPLMQSNGGAWAECRDSGSL